MKKYMYKHKGYLMLSLFCSLLAAVLAVRVQFLKGDVLDLALSKNFDQTMAKAFVLVLFILMEIGFYYLYDHMRGRFAVVSIRELREDFFGSLLKKRYPDYLKVNQAEYLAKYTNEMEIIENQYFSTIPMFAEILIKIIMVSGSLFILDYRIAFITLLLLTTPLYVPKLVEKHLQRAQMDYVESFEKHLNLVNDWLKGFELIKNFSVEDKVLKKFAFSNELTMGKNLKKRQMANLTRSISSILSYMSHFIILTFAAYLVLRGEFTAGKFFISIGMIDQLSYPIISLSYFLQDLVSVGPVNARMIKFMESSKEDQVEPSIDLEGFGEITFQDVSFGYGEEELLQNLNMTFKKNKRYLLQGPSGSGKTTSMNLLLDYDKPSEGHIFVDGYEVHEIKHLNKLFTVMRQDAVLFQESLRTNLSLYQEIDDEKLIEVLEQVGLKKFASKDKLDMQIEEDGNNLSGGEKRRITLARSLLREAPLMILDEPLANLDAENASSIEDLLLSIQDRTMIVISHQFSPSKRSDFQEIYSFSR